MSPRFQLELDRERYTPGETIKGTILVREGGGSRALEAGTSFEFELALPPDALPSYKSRHGELYWELDVKSDESGRDTHERRRIETVSPSS
jgi:hypothetical protein